MTPQEEGAARVPPAPPLGVQLAGAAKVVSRAFDDALAAVGGSRPVWLVLMAVRAHPGASQQRLAEQIGIRAATLTHHLTAMERGGLVTRTREPGDRRNQAVQLRPEGERMFQTLRAAAREFDRRLHDSLSDDEVASFRRVLVQLVYNVGGSGPPGSAPCPRP